MARQYRIKISVEFTLSIELALYYNIRNIIIKGRSVYKSHRYSGIIENKVILADSHSC